MPLSFHRPWYFVQSNFCFILTDTRKDFTLLDSDIKQSYSLSLLNLVESAAPVVGWGSWQSFESLNHSFVPRRAWRIILSNRLFLLLYFFGTFLSPLWWPSRLWMVRIQYGRFRKTSTFSSSLHAFIVKCDPLIIELVSALGWLHNLFVVIIDFISPNSRDPFAALSYEVNGWFSVLSQNRWLFGDVVEISFVLGGLVRTRTWQLLLSVYQDVKNSSHFGLRHFVVSVEIETHGRVVVVSFDSERILT